MTKIFGGFRFGMYLSAILMLTSWEIVFAISGFENMVKWAEYTTSVFTIGVVGIFCMMLVGTDFVNREREKRE